MGAYRYSMGENQEGRAFIYYGSPTGLSPVEEWTAESDQALAHFGIAVASAGDVNGDGFADVLIGASVYDTNKVDVGRAYVFHGPDPLVVGIYCAAGTSASGCVARISSSGVASATAPSGFVLNTSSVEGAKTGLYLIGTNGRRTNLWGNGPSYHCLIPPTTSAGLLRGTGNRGACDGAFAQDLNALWCSTCPKPAMNPGAGVIVQAQIWYRDPLNTSVNQTSLSDALELLVAP